MSYHRQDRRDAILSFLGEYIRRSGYPPTYAEIGQALGLSTKSLVSHYLKTLEAAGKIERTPHRSRGIRLVDPAPARWEIGIEGQIAAGAPIERGYVPDLAVEVPPWIANLRKELYALRVKGDSMVNDLVADGDIVIVEKKSEAARGQMAVVHLRSRNEATLKRFYPEGEMVRLQPANPTMPPIYVRADDVEIQGRVVAIIRQLD